ncbi:DNA primase family protein [Methanosarcina siciliae]|nr:phage/plasmid primase, P4 family [Methanosarcina siciliae]
MTAEQLWNNTKPIKCSIGQQMEYEPPAGSLMARLRSKYNKLPDLDPELCNFIITDPTIDELINTDFEKVTNPGNVYRKLTGKLIDFTDKEIDLIITTYAKSNFWEMIPEGSRMERIQQIKEEKKENERVSKRRPDKTDKTKIKVPFKDVGDKIMNTYSLFVMADTKEFYVYINGVYKNEGSELFIRARIRAIYGDLYEEKLRDECPDIDDVERPTPGSKYIHEVLEYIRDCAFIQRREIDQRQLNSRYINLTNGLFNLDTWKLEPHDPEYLSISQIPVTYDTKANCPEIKNYLVSCELEEKNVNLLLEFAGYCLIPDVSMQKALMLYGTGSNGKSVFINLLKNILGKGNVSSETLQDLEENPYRVANLYGKLLNAFPDLKDSTLQTNEKFNTLTGNDTELMAERKYQNSFSFNPTVKLMFSANRIPFAYSDNYAYYRRWMLIKFPRTFEKNEIDEHLINKLTTEQEKSGFLNLMLAGLKQVIQNRKFSYDMDVTEVTEVYRLNSDNAAVFEEGCCRDCEGDEKPTHAKLVFKYYTIWCGLKGVTPLKESAFRNRMAKLGRNYRRSTEYNKDTKKSDNIYFYEGTYVYPTEIK